MTRSTALANVVLAQSAAIYGYGIVVGQLSGRAARRARRALEEYEQQRDRWIAVLVAEQDPVPTPQVAYAMPFPVYTARSARALAAVIDERIVGWYADLAAVGTPDERRAAVNQARACATRAVTWGASPRAFPGENVETQPEDE